MRRLYLYPLRRLTPTGYFSWYHEEMEDAFQKGLPGPDEAAIRDRIFKKHMETPDLTTVKGFLRYHTATSKEKIVEIIIRDSLDTLTTSGGHPPDLRDS